MSTFNTNNVSRRAYTGVFPEADYTVVLDKVVVTEASTGTWMIESQLRLRDNARYNNRVVFIKMFITEKAFEVTVNQIQDMGIELPALQSTSAKKIAEKLAAAMPIGHKFVARLYEATPEGATRPQLLSRGFTPFVQE